MTERPPTPRQLARIETIEQITAIARDHVAAYGPAGLSLRAVARDLGMVSSAVYRYFANREELLTALVADGLGALGAAVEQADAGLARRSIAGRWQAIAAALRAWATDNPYQYGLLYAGGYGSGPLADPALSVLMGLLADGAERGAVASPTERLPPAVRANVAALAESAGFEGVAPVLAARGLTVWAYLHGTIAAELSGRGNGALGDSDAWFDHQVKLLGRQLGVVK